MLTKSSIHTIRALVIMAKAPDTYRGAESLADAIGAPKRYLGKLLQQLSRRNILESQKGKFGGFRLGRPAAEIRLVEIVESLSEFETNTQCLLGNRECDHDDPCPIHDRWRRAQDSYYDMLENTTLEDLKSAKVLDGF